jgi:hypothetical protein
METENLIEQLKKMTYKEDLFKATQLTISDYLEWYWRVSYDK